MRVLVTGGSGVIGEGLIPQLLKRGHHVRLLTRGADREARAWPEEVESFAADVSDPEQLIRAADRCDGIVHISGIVEEQPPDITFQKVNVDGTRNLLRECARAGSPKVIFISSLGADRGTSAYHGSKREAETIVRTCEGPWVILRSGNVYGPGDDVISKLLSMHRTLPAIPVIGAGDQRFQPIWYEDLGQAITHALETDVERGVYEVAGNEVTTPNEILNAFERITGRKPARIPVPEFLAGVATRVAAAAGVAVPINEAQFQMLIEENVVRPPENNALTRVFGVTPTPLLVGLTRLADIQPEQTPEQGVGGMEQKLFWADIAHSRFNAEGLMAEFRTRATELMPIEFDAEPGAPQDVVHGATLTAKLPMRGNVQIRVVEVSPRTVTFATLRGHPLAGVVRFTTSEPGAGLVRFSVTVFARAATMLDWLALSTGGSAAQNSTWTTVVERMIDVSGGTSSGVQQETRVARGDETADVEAWIADLIAEHKRVEHTRHASPS